jgi:hypothetical protein
MSDKITVEELDRVNKILQGYGNLALSGSQPKKYSSWLAQSYVSWLAQRSAETGNACYAAEAWLICRAHDFQPPDEVLACVDRAAITGEFFSTRGRGRGNLSDQRKRFREKDVSDWILKALEMYEERPRPQNALAADLGIDAGEFSRMCQPYRLSLPWHWE